MSAYRSRKSGFTLVEILIVVIILGILAAIVIPQFTNASTDARESSVKSQLQTLRSQIELYKLQHNDTLPNLVTNWTQFLSKTNSAGTVGTGTGFDYGPYLQAIPTNGLNGLSNVVNGDWSAGGGSISSGSAGFAYDYASGAGTGRIWATAANGTAQFAE